jgi:hypothetical protein
VSDAAIRAAIRDAVERRGAGKTTCPSEVARELATEWRPLMPEVRRVARDMAAADEITVTQKGRPVDAVDAPGPIRLGLPDA